MPCHARSGRPAVGGPRWRRWPPLDGTRRRRRCPSRDARGSTVTGADGKAVTRHEPAADADGQADAVAAASGALEYRPSTDAANASFTGPGATAGPGRRAAAGHEQACHRWSGGHARRHTAAVVPAAERRPEPTESRPTLAAERRGQADRSLPCQPLDRRPDDTAFVPDTAGHRGDEATYGSGPNRDEARAGSRHPGRRQPRWTHPPIAAARYRKPPGRRFCDAALTGTVAQAGRSRHDEARPRSRAAGAARLPEAGWRR